MLGWQVIDSRALTVAESTTLDKWYRQTVEPPRQPQRASSLQPTYDIDPTAFAAVPVLGPGKHFLLVWVYIPGASMVEVVI